MATVIGQYGAQLAVDHFAVKHAVQVLHAAVVAVTYHIARFSRDVHPVGSTVEVVGRGHQLGRSSQIDLAGLGSRREVAGNDVVDQLHTTGHDMNGRTVEVGRGGTAARVARVGVARDGIVDQVESPRRGIEIDGRPAVRLVGEGVARGCQPIVDKSIVDKNTVHIYRGTCLGIDPVAVAHVTGKCVASHPREHHAVGVAGTALHRPVLLEIRVVYVGAPAGRHQIESSALQSRPIAGKDCALGREVASGVYGTAISRGVVVGQAHIAQHKVYPL